MSIAKTKVVCALSGGMDSATVFGSIIDRPRNFNEALHVYAISFEYPSKHNYLERIAARQLIDYYRSKITAASLVTIHYRVVDVSEVFLMAPPISALLDTEQNVPQGHYAADNMKKTVVPGRNLIFLSMLAAYAEVLGAKEVHCGVHAGDHEIYPDCRPEFIAALNETVRQSSEGRVRICAPFLGKDKADILEIGYSLSIPVPYQLTRTCYNAEDVACGKCGSCQERLHAFRAINRPDPLNYASRTLVDKNGKAIPNA